MITSIRKRLLSMQETTSDYLEFSSGLVPGVKHMIGIRLPELRKLAKEIARSDWKTAISEEDIYFEERMLHGMVLNYVPENLEELLPFIEELIPLIDNWSVCDSVFTGMKVFQTDRERTWEFIQPYLKSDSEFEIRVALLVMMQHLLKCDANGKKIVRKKRVSIRDCSDRTEEKGLFLERIFSVLDHVKTEKYYASMMAAWLTVEAFCCFPCHTMEYWKHNQLDAQTRQRAVRKICESKIPEPDVKELIRQIPFI